MRDGAMPPVIVAAPDGSLKRRQRPLQRRQLLPQHAGRRPLRGLPDAGRVGLPLQPLPHPPGARRPPDRRRVDGRRRRLPHGHQVPRPFRLGAGVPSAAERALGGLPRPHTWPISTRIAGDGAPSSTAAVQVVGRYLPRLHHPRAHGQLPALRPRQPRRGRAGQPATTPSRCSTPTTCATASSTCTSPTPAATNSTCDAQVESFLYHAHERGLHVTVDYWPRGHHDTATVLGMLPNALDWIGPKLAPYAPHD